MPRVFRLLRRVAQASPHELWTRSRQLIFTVRNYSGYLAGGSALSSHGHLRALRRDSRELASWWKTRRQQWFITPERVGQWQSWSEDSSSSLPWILQRAEDVTQGKLPLFSYGDLDYTMPRRWSHDAIGQKTAPDQFYGQVPYLDPNVVGDSKHVWEPNRFAWALWLGVAYRVTGDAKYAHRFRQWTLDWFRENPYPQGINYCSALELAFRNYAWVWSLSLFAEYLEDDVEVLERLLHGIWTAARHVEENLSLYFAPNTHILGEAFGLFATGAAIPEFQDAARWRSLGLRLLDSESQKQFYQDGMHRELSSGYHIYSTDMYLQAVQIGKESGFRVPDNVEQTARRAALRLAQIAPRDSVLPAFNDCDGGRLISLVPESLDAGPTLFAAQQLFPHDSFLPRQVEAAESREFRGASRGYPLLMSSMTQPRDAEKTRRTFELPIGRELKDVFDSGLASYRTEAGDYVLLRGSEFGYMDCPHSHDGGLGVIVHLKDVPVFVDSGVGSYTQSEECRNTFRTARGKNTILVNGQGPSTPDGWFTWSRTTDSQLVSMSRFRGGFSARAKHAGYSDPPTHTFVHREVIVLDIGIVAIIDRWDADEEIGVETAFTVHPDLHVDTARKLLTLHSEQEFHFDAFSLLLGEELEFVDNEQDFSSNYGHTDKTKSLGFRHAAIRRGGIITFLSRCGPILCGNDTAIVTVGDVQFERTASGLMVHETSPIEQLS